MSIEGFLVGFVVGAIVIAFLIGRMDSITFIYETPDGKKFVKRNKETFWVVPKSEGAE